MINEADAMKARADRAEAALAIAREALEESNGYLAMRVNELEAVEWSLTSARVESARLREALQWYADNSSPPCDCCDQQPSVLMDGGDRARAALASTPAEETT